MDFQSKGKKSEKYYKFPRNKSSSLLIYIVLKRENVFAAHIVVTNFTYTSANSTNYTSMEFNRPGERTKNL